LTTHTRQSEQVLELSLVCIHAGMQRRDREQKSFVEIKPVLVVKRVKI